MSFPLAIAPTTVLLIAAAYLLGSLSGRYVLGRLAVGFRGTGPGPLASAESAGFIVARIAFDLAKGALPTWLALRHAPVGDPLSVTAHGYVAAFAALLGDVRPPWRRVRGGDGAAVLAGALLVLWPVAVAVWLIAGVAAWLLSGHLGLSIVAGAIFLPLLAWWSGSDPPRLWFSAGAALLLMLVHRQHLWRLWTGTEPRFARARRLHRWRRK